MNESRFLAVVILHDLNNETWVAARLGSILAEHHPSVKFLLPPLPAGTLALAPAVALLPMFKPNSLFVGLGLGGNLAALAQDRFPSLNLSVFAVDPPEMAAAPERVVLYNSLEPRSFAGQAYGVPWLAQGVDKAAFAVAYLISAYMRGLDLAKEVPQMFPEDPASI